MTISKNQKTIASLILSYLVKHPEAMDTVEGITRWWLLRERIDQSLAAVTKTLEFLQQQGFIQVREICNSQFYKLNKIKSNEIQKFLENLDSNNEQ